MRAPCLWLQIFRSQQCFHRSQGSQDPFFVSQGQGNRPGEKPSTVPAIQIRTKRKISGFFQKMLLDQLRIPEELAKASLGIKKRNTKSILAYCIM
ncbi:hypothetical protein TNIN_366681 [Trichonephila inaurata madagascariensis]|uniref:Uncharacterized protein n=1 Tax=Trichonephila inaurata madagascariensis TaxID=2747483 RepID=A0A8X6J778_9ARAC|nr:hypothetical protein TNIN_366681 [Trichonephila inaurata madagascariensis]